MWFSSHIEVTNCENAILIEGRHGTSFRTVAVCHATIMACMCQCTTAWSVLATKATIRPGRSEVSHGLKVVSSTLLSLSTLSPPLLPPLRHMRACEGAYVRLSTGPFIYLSFFLLKPPPPPTSLVLSSPLPSCLLLLLSVWNTLRRLLSSLKLVCTSVGCILIRSPRLIPT